jgi:hypothetical protein
VSSLRRSSNDSAPDAETRSGRDPGSGQAHQHAAITTHRSANPRASRSTSACNGVRRATGEAREDRAVASRATRRGFESGRASGCLGKPVVNSRVPNQEGAGCFAECRRMMRIKMWRGRFKKRCRRESLDCRGAQESPDPLPDQLRRSHDVIRRERAVLAMSRGDSLCVVADLVAARE